MNPASVPPRRTAFSPLSVLRLPPSGDGDRTHHDPEGRVESLARAPRSSSRPPPSAAGARRQARSARSQATRVRPARAGRERARGSGGNVWESNPPRTQKRPTEDLKSLGPTRTHALPRHDLHALGEDTHAAQPGSTRASGRGRIAPTTPARLCAWRGGPRAARAP